MRENDQRTPGGPAATTILGGRPLELENLELASGPIALRLRVVPEPAGLALVGLVLTALRMRRQRRA